MRIIDAVAARWLVAEVELGGEFLAVCLQHLQASWKEAPHVQPPRRGRWGRSTWCPSPRMGSAPHWRRPWRQTGPRSPAAAADLPPQSDQTEMMDRVIGTSEKHDFKINIV